MQRRLCVGWFIRDEADGQLSLGRQVMHGNRPSYRGYQIDYSYRIILDMNRVSGIIRLDRVIRVTHL